MLGNNISPSLFLEPGLGSNNSNNPYKALHVRLCSETHLQQNAEEFAV